MGRYLPRLTLPDELIDELAGQHESAHCILAVCMGFRILGCRLAENSRGDMAHTDDAPLEHRFAAITERPASLADRRVVVLFGGEAAELRRMGRYYPAAAGYDYRDVQRVSGEHSESSHNQKLRGIARLLTARFWPAIVCLGRRIQRARYLDGKEATGLAGAFILQLLGKQ